MNNLERALAHDLKKFEMDESVSRQVRAIASAWFRAGWNSALDPEKNPASTSTSTGDPE